MAKNKNRPPQQQGKQLPPAQPAPLAGAAAGATPLIFTATQITGSNFQGPLPQPEILKAYQDLLPGLAERIIAMAEDEAAHRRRIEEKIVNGQLQEARRYRRSEWIGQVCGLAIGITSIVAAVYAGVHGAQITGSFIGTAGVT